MSDSQSPAVVPFLSRLSTAPGSPAVAQHGVWQERRPGVLRQIALHTVSDAAAEFGRQSRSVPSIWGYAQLFHEVWADSRHPNHSYVVELWRRFLGAVMLRERTPGLDIRLNRFSLGPDEDRTRFASAAWQQIPWSVFGLVAGAAVEVPLIGVTEWTAVGRIDEGRVIGLGLRGLLLLPGRAVVDPERGGQAVSERLRRRLGLLSDGSLSRASYWELWGERDSVDLVVWLGEAILSLRGLGARDLGGLATLRDHLQEFRSALAQDVEAKSVAPLASGSWTLGAGDLTDLPVPLRALALHPPLGSSGRTCHLVLRRLIGEQSGQSDRRLALVADSMTTDSVLRELQITNRASASTSRTQKIVLIQNLNEADVARQRRNLLSEHNVLIVTPDDLFERVLVRFDGDRDFPKHPPGFERFLLPLQPLALALLPRGGTFQRLRCRVEGGRVTVSIVLEVGPAEQPIAVTLEKTYAGGDIVDAALPTALAVWPDFFAEGPVHNLVYQSTEVSEGRSMPMITAQHVLSASRLVDALNDLLAPGAGADLMFDKRLPDTSMAWLSRDQGLRSRVLLESVEPIEALVCTAGPGRGLLMLDRRRETALDVTEGTEVTAAVDFGTTNTTVAIRFGAQEDLPERRIQPHVWLPFGTPVAGDNTEDLPPAEAILAKAVTGDFLPTHSTIVAPFLSMVELRQGVVPADTGVPLARARIPFVREMGLEDAIKRILNSNRLPMRHELGLKWEAGPGRRDHVKAFLRQLVLLVSAQVRARGVDPARIRWRFTLPGSLDRDVRVLFVREVGEVVSRPDQASRGDISITLESAAAFHYVLHHEPEHVSNVVVLLDVGGRSTDIAVLVPQAQGATADRFSAWDGSVRVAGQTVLLDDWLQREDDLLELLDGIRDVPLKGEELRAVLADPGKRKPFLEVLLNTDAIAAQFWHSEGRGPRAEALMARTRLRARLALLGLAWFVIHFVLPPLVASGKVPTERLTLFFGGRGSKIFAALCRRSAGGPFIDQPTIEGWLNSAGFGEGCRPVFSKNPKFEVALGALHAPATPVATLRDAAAAPGRAENTGIGTAVPPADPNGGLRSFCNAVAMLFPELPRLSSAFDDAGGSYEIRNVLNARLAMSNRIAFSDSGIGAGNRDDPRRTFIIGLEALLERYDDLHSPA